MCTSFCHHDLLPNCFVQTIELNPIPFPLPQSKKMQKVHFFHPLLPSYKMLQRDFIKPKAVPRSCSGTKSQIIDWPIGITTLRPQPKLQQDEIAAVINDQLLRGITFNRNCSTSVNCCFWRIGLPQFNHPFGIQVAAKAAPINKRRKKCIWYEEPWDGCCVSYCLHRKVLWNKGTKPKLQVVVGNLVTVVYF